MGAPLDAAARLKREDHRRTKHDSAFSKWKILIGPSDWENHRLCKDGAERYRIQNLPSNPGPGVYEIGVPVGPIGSGREVGKLDPDRIVVVYLGQADNVRSRLQSYGRGGSHLEKGNDRSNWFSLIELGDGGSSPNSGLFKEIFGRGLPIVYRWASMNSKRDAERTEAELLARFDYAWNKVANGTKRPTDALLKIDEMSSKTISTAPKLVKMIKSLTQKRAGIPIKPSHNEPDQAVDQNSNSLGFLARVFKFGRSQPRPVVFQDDIRPECHNLDSSTVCGITLVDGSLCTNPAVKGRKRCPDHKGMRKGTTVARPVYLDDICNEKQMVEDIGGEFFSPVCGVTLLDGSPCSNKPVSGRKRCEEHKGMRIQQVSTPKISYKDYDIVEEQELTASSRRSFTVGSNCCGVSLSCGSFCERQPIKGRKRCDEHKGMRVRRCLSMRVAPEMQDFGAPDHLAMSV